MKCKRKKITLTTLQFQHVTVNFFHCKITGKPDEFLMIQNCAIEK